MCEYRILHYADTHCLVWHYDGMECHYVTTAPRSNTLKHSNEINYPFEHAHTGMCVCVCLRMHAWMIKMASVYHLQSSYTWHILTLLGTTV